MWIIHHIQTQKWVFNAKIDSVNDIDIAMIDSNQRYSIVLYTLQSNLFVMRLPKTHKGQPQSINLERFPTIFTRFGIRLRNSTNRRKTNKMNIKTGLRQINKFESSCIDRFVERYAQELHHRSSIILHERSEITWLIDMHQFIFIVCCDFSMSNRSLKQKNDHFYFEPSPKTWSAHSTTLPKWNLHKTQSIKCFMNCLWFMLLLFSHEIKSQNL